MLVRIFTSIQHTDYKIGIVPCVSIRRIITRSESRQLDGQITEPAKRINLQRDRQDSDGYN